MDEVWLSQLKERVDTVKRSLAGASEGKYPVPRIIPVTKLHPVSWIEPLHDLGFSEIGENHVQ